MVALPGAEMLSQGRALHRVPAAPQGPGAIAADGDASESSVGTYSRPVDTQRKEAYFSFNPSILWGCFLLHERKI